ncbi:MAG: ATP-binding protein [Ferruginibacter sp.]
MKSATQVLVIDDDEDDFFIIREYISKIEGKQFVIDWCAKYNEAENKIATGKYDLYFIDYQLNPKTGLELIKQSVENNCEEPFILLTGNGSRTIGLQAMEAGAADYLVKGELNTEKLERCIRYSLERAASLKALKASERKFRGIFERSKDMAFTADESLLFTDLNAACLPLLGYDSTQLLGKNLSVLFAEPEEGQRIIEQIKDGRDLSDKEIVFLTKSGEKKYGMLSLSRQIDFGGRLYLQGIVHDITLLKKEAKTKMLLENLNVTGRLVRMMAHEVRNPVNNIMLAVEQLNGTPQDGEHDICLDIINRNSRRIEGIIADLLNSSRPTHVAVEKKSLQEVMEETLEAAIDRITLKRIALEKEYTNVPAWVMADMEKLKIAFLNIIINAIEAMEEEKGVLRVSITPGDKQFVVCIADNGCGISSEHLPHLFEPYYTSKTNGMGLGLTSSLNILKSHDASFDVQSSPEKGTIFSLFFAEA